jgi:hypothetical protein
LNVLTEPVGCRPAPLEAKDLLDPWGRPYVYDPNETHPKSPRPLLYSQGAEPGKSPRIRNWEADGKKKDE